MDFDVIIGDFCNNLFCKEKYAIGRLIHKGDFSSIYKVKQMD